MADTQPLDRLGTRTAGPERQRLEHREARLRHVVALLRERAAEHVHTSGAAPRPLTEAISGFATELTAVRARLAELERGRGRPRDRPRSP